ncbi:hypothetical protein [Vibrio sp. V39_P1S14PM300]|uniref:hypothetical protein n=1 Tax=Vibrio sp. V39_P1S14PM300 TaxID=1938690 RepID=UPI001410BAD0|nr:hypothetical protein [Vibrio sp. V39_P1S14PM300]NAX20278.1 hypothetical protein [Vibrio sp. V39_P1S14PM300]
MKKRIQKVLIPMLTLMLSAGLVACSDDNSAEDVGEKIDQAVTDTGNAIEDSCENLKESANAQDTDC